MSEFISMEGIDQVVGIVVQCIEVISASILLLGFLKASRELWRVEMHVTGNTGNHKLAVVRHSLATYILLGLDFYIVSDILRSMIHPGLDELISLAVIVVMRTTIGFFLGKEIIEIERLRQS